MIDQPTEIPGAWAVENAHLPPANGVVSRAWPGHNVYGLYCYTGPYRRLRKQIRSVGWSFIRMGEGTGPQGPLTETDLWNLGEDGIEISVHAGDGPPRNAYPNDEAFITAAEARAFNRVMRMREHVSHWHVWNEPNYGYMIPGANNPTRQRAKARLYGKLLWRVSDVIRGAQPEATILGFDTGGAGPNAAALIRDVYWMYPGIHSAFDVMATHPGVSPTPPETDHLEHWGRYSIARHLADCRAIIRSAPRTRGHRRPQWFTEGGWPITYGAGGRYDVDPARAMSQRLQAAYLVRYYAMALRMGVDRVCPFFIEDADGINSGVFGPDGEWREAAHAIKEMIGQMPNPKLAHVLKDGAHGMHAYSYYRDFESESPGATVMAWAVAGPGVMDIDMGTDRVQVVDMLGGSTESASPSGVHSIDVGPCPVYIKAVPA